MGTGYNRKKVIFNQKSLNIALIKEQETIHASGTANHKHAVKAGDEGVSTNFFRGVMSPKLPSNKKFRRQIKKWKEIKKSKSSIGIK